MNCERCGRSDADAGKVIHYKKHDYNMNLCDNCIGMIEKPHNEKCMQCGKLVWKNGGAKKHDGKILCLYCHQDILASKDKMIKPKTSMYKKRNFWFSVGLAVVGILILTEYV